MKNVLQILAVALGVMCFSFSYAQENQVFESEQANETAVEHNHPHAKKVHARAKKIKEELQLSDEQVAQWKEIRKKYHPQLKELRERHRNGQEVSKEEIRSVMKAKDAEFEAILDANQLEKWAELKAEMKGKFKESREKRGRG